MKNFFEKTAVTVAAIVLIAVAAFGHVRPAEAFTFPSFSLKNIFENRIQNDRQNAAKNRDERNTLLEAKTGSDRTGTSDADAAAGSTEIIDNLSLSLSNLENIDSRIDARAADAAGQGYDMNTVTVPLADAEMELDIASSSIADLAATSTDPGSSIASTTDTLASAKGYLGDALAALKAIVGN